MRAPRPSAVIVAFLAGLGACKKEEVRVVYQAMPVETRDIVVSAQAAGRIVPDTIVEVKTRASGEILRIFVETGQQVRRGDRLLAIDPRLPQNSVSLAQASLDVAKVQARTAETQLRRADTLLAVQTITRAEHETAQLAHANARAQLARAEIDIENSKINFDDTDVRAPVRIAACSSATVASSSSNAGTAAVAAVCALPPPACTSVARPAAATLIIVRRSIASVSDGYDLDELACIRCCIVARIHLVGAAEGLHREDIGLSLRPGRYSGSGNEPNDAADKSVHVSSDDQASLIVTGPMGWVKPRPADRDPPTKTPNVCLAFW